MTDFGVAVAGVGWLGESLIKELPCAPSLRLVGVQDVRIDVARAVADRYGCGFASDSYEALLARADVDVVAICTPNALHVPQARAALESGKHMLVQKPLALSAADAAATVELAQRRRRVLFVDYTYRFLETTQLLTRASGVRSVRAAFHNIYGPGTEKTWFFDSRMSGGGALVDLGVHLLDLALWLLGPSGVRLERAELTDAPIDTSAVLRLQCDEVPVEIAVSWNAALPATDIAVELEAANGLWRWENVDGSFFRFRTVHDGVVLLDRETTLREDTLRALEHALQSGQMPDTDVRVYALLDQAYGRAS